MEIAAFLQDLCEQATELAWADYEEERSRVPEIPFVAECPRVNEFASNGLGVAVHDEERLIGFLCCTGPVENNFGKATGIFSPLHAHAVERKKTVRRSQGDFELSPVGENFVTRDRSMANSGGVYRTETERGAEAAPVLLSFVIRTLTGEGFAQVGVDFESINPAARGFWLKHFTPYMYSMTWRIDERILNRPDKVPGE